MEYSPERVLMSVGEIIINILLDKPNRREFCAQQTECSAAGGGGASRLYPISLTGTIYVISRRNYNKFPTPRGSPSSPPPLIFKPPTPLLYSISALLIFGEPIWFLRLAELGGWGVGGSVGKSFFGACQLFFLLGQGEWSPKKKTHTPLPNRVFFTPQLPTPPKMGI